MGFETYPPLKSTLSTRLQYSVGKKITDNSDKICFCQKEDGKKEHGKSNFQERDWHKGAAMFPSYHVLLLCVCRWRGLCSFYSICTFQLLKSQIKLEYHLQAVWLCPSWNGQSWFVLWIRWKMDVTLASATFAKLLMDVTHGSAQVLLLPMDHSGFCMLPKHSDQESPFRWWLLQTRNLSMSISDTLESL